MRRSLIAVFSFLGYLCQGQQPYITTWQVTSENLTVAIPLNGANPSLTYNYTVDFGDGTILTNQSSFTLHTYNQPGIYTVSISGIFPYWDWFVGDQPPPHYWYRHKIMSVEQWGDIQWSNTNYLFFDCPNVQINATDSPDLSQVSSINHMFRNADSMNANLDNWDVSNVTQMQWVFSDTDNFDQPLNSWDVSNVISMHSMFKRAINFNQPLDNWDVSSVTDMNGMFENASSFNQDLSNWSFNTSNLEDFISYSGFSSNNYDLLLNRLLQLGLQNGNLGAADINYCDAFARQQLINNGWTIIDAGLADDCNYNSVSGSVTYDMSNNGCDPNDIPFSNFLMNVNDGTNDFSYPLNENGQYNIMLDSGNYTLNIIDTSNNFNSNPSTQNVNFTSQNQTLDNIDFCMTANSVVEDLSIDIFPLGDAIPGFETNYLIHIENNGTEVVQNVQATLTFDDNFQSFMSSTFPPSSQTSNTLSFNLGSLNPFASESIEITLINAIPPTLNGGEILSFTTQVTPVANDSNPTDNTAIYNQVVVNSFDPNDKMVVQGDEIADENIGEYLDYRIRFQNVGTANALNVRIIDSISNNLDWTTFQPISASHDYRIEVKNQKQITYYFDNINLPYEDADAEGSNGYITYKIKPKSSFQIGDTFENTAYIYFDFNLPIVTNTVVTTVVDELSTIALNLDAINLYPNPVKDILHLDIPPTFEFNSLSLFDLKGRLVKKISFQNQIDLEELSSGVYILQLDTNKGIFNEKIIKK